MITIRERSSSAGPTGVTTRAETVERPAPPCRGMQPSLGWNTSARFDSERARKSAYVVVVTPGETGAPTRPSKPTRTAREVACASRPPTTARPRGHESRNCDVPPAGTTTQGPGTRMQAVTPWHAFVAAFALAA